MADTKLKRRPHPKHVLQLVLNSDLLTEVQGVAPEFAHVELGTGERASLRLEDYSHYARAARARLEAFAAAPKPTRPVPCADCGLCHWADHCESVWQAEDSLFNVANISRGLRRDAGTGASDLGQLLIDARIARARETQTSIIRLACQAKWNALNLTGIDEDCHERTNRAQ